VKRWTGLKYLKTRPIAVFCKKSTEPLDSIKMETSLPAEYAKHICFKAGPIPWS
jgi:hypothetical protein